MRDRLTLGALCGVIAQSIKFPIGLLSASLTGVPLWGDVHVAAGIFLSPDKVRTPLGLAIGFAATLAITATLGIAVVYLLTITGKDYWRIKGPAVGVFAWLGLWGVLANLEISRIVPTDYSSNIWTFFAYIFWGYVTASLALRWGDESLFAGIKRLS